MRWRHVVVRTRTDCDFVYTLLCLVQEFGADVRGNSLEK